jgi:glycosyltransferase involved in cell wall biosynthesis
MGVPLRVVLYCPDRHLTYDGRTPDDVGVGGGVTARVRMARALARLGHSVTQIVNCPRYEMIDGVEYRPLDEAGRLEVDVVVFNTSGGALDLTPALGLNLQARLRIIWVHGTQVPGSLDRLPYDAVYCVSNFLRRIVADAWDVPSRQIFVTYNGYEAAHFASAEGAAPERDPFQLIYFSHPSKGLETAMAVLHELRRAESRFHLEVVGGPRLWGGAEAARIRADGVRDCGLLGQRALVPLLLRSAYALQMQDREEPGALAILDAARAGCVIIANAVGCYVEQVIDCLTGAIVPGDHRTAESRRAAAERILSFHAHPESGARIAANARAWALDTDTLARAWTQDWLIRLDAAQPIPVKCAHCGGSAYRLEDGDHCTACGMFTRIVPGGGPG